MVPFGGWDMPVEYSGVVAEHLAVRERAGMFDVSHMGQIEIGGTNALQAVQQISCNDASRLEIGQAQYSGLLTPRGTFVRCSSRLTPWRTTTACGITHSMDWPC